MNRKRLATFWEQYGTLCILVLIIVVFSGLSSDFMKPENIVQIFVQSAITILVALGKFFAILIAELTYLFVRSLRLRESLRQS